MKNYLNTEEQFKRILSNVEISRIRDDELRNIRQKYWDKRHKANLDEKNIPDWEIGNVHNKLIEEEQKEIMEYRNRKGI